MNYYAGIGAYTREILTELLDFAGMQGVIFGDLFCQRRMFANGEWEILKFAEQAKRKGKEVILQTPMYLTPEKLTHWVHLISCMQTSNLLNAVLVQDMGLIYLLALRYPTLKLCWSRMGKGRGGMINSQFVSFLQEMGVYAMEIGDHTRAKAVAHMGMYVWQIYGSLEYKTLWRECYTSYQLGLNADICLRKCETPLELISNELKMTVNGHLLGEKISFSLEASLPWAVSERMVLYAKTLDELKEVTII